MTADKPTQVRPSPRKKTIAHLPSCRILPCLLKYRRPILTQQPPQCQPLKAKKNAKKHATFPKKSKKIPRSIPHNSYFLTHKSYFIIFSPLALPLLIGYPDADVFEPILFYKGLAMTIYHRKLTVLLILTAFSVPVSARTIVRDMYLDELDIAKVQAGWGTPHRSKSVEGNPLTIEKRTFERGIGTHAPSAMWIELDGWTSDFTAWVGVDDEVADSRASVEFIIIGKGEVMWKSGLMTAKDPAKEVNLNIRGVKKLGLIVSPGPDGMNYDHADWADAKLRVTNADPKMISPAAVEPYILTPVAPDEARINGPKVFGVRPGSPVLYTIPATGARPMTFSAENLPKNLKIDEKTGQITGKLTEKAEYNLTLTAKNARGACRRPFRIVVGDQICLTPPLGWNSWNCWAGAVDAEKIEASTKAMVDSGLVNHGWTYINIDDTWQGERGGELKAIQGNDKFPDMKALADYVHSLGLKIGIYSTPWVTSYAGYVGGSSDNADGKWSRETDPTRTGWRHGKYPFAENDAKQWAKWGFDYLKYDWNPNDIPHVTEMADALRASGRDIVYSLSNSAPFDKAGDWVRLANCWRTTGDIRDTWSSISSIGFSQDKWAPFAGTGHFNDADMLVVGEVGWGPNLHPSNLTPDEQYTHISLWCLLASPMLLGCDLTRLDDFTLNLLTNDEVLDVNQDPLCRQGRQVVADSSHEIWAKEMEDGSIAVGLFNRDFLFEESKKITLDFSALDIEGPRGVRDLWRQKDLGVFEDEFEADVPPHGVVLIRVIPDKM